MREVVKRPSERVHDEFVLRVVQQGVDGEVALPAVLVQVCACGRVGQPAHAEAPVVQDVAVALRREDGADQGVGAEAPGALGAGTVLFEEVFSEVAESTGRGGPCGIQVADLVWA